MSMNRRDGKELLRKYEGAALQQLRMEGISIAARRLASTQWLAAVID